MCTRALVLVCCLALCAAEPYEQYMTQFTLRAPTVSGDALLAAVAELLLVFNHSGTFSVLEVA